MNDNANQQTVTGLSPGSGGGGLFDVAAYIAAEEAAGNQFVADRFGWVLMATEGSKCMGTMPLEQLHDFAEQRKRDGDWYQSVANYLIARG